MKTRVTLLIFNLLTTTLVAQLTYSWTKKNNFLAGKRERAVAFSIGDFGYVATGVDTAEVVHNDLWQYNPVDDSWTQLADLPGSARRDAVGFSINGFGYVGSGIDNEVSIIGNKKKDFWKYNPILNQWDSIAPYPGSGGNGIYSATAFTADNKGFVCGGKIGPGIYSKQLWEYKPSNNQWIQRADFPGGVRYQLCSFSIDNIGYVGLGLNQDVYKKDFYKYNPGSDEWAQIATFPAMERGGASTFVLNNKGYVCLGTNGGLQGDLLEYNPELNSWFLRQSFGGSERKNAISFVVNEKAYVGLGKGYSGKKSSIYEYGPNLFASIENLQPLQFQVYPNPSSGTVFFQLKSMENQEILFFDLYGNMLFSKCVSDQMILDLSCLPKGVYFLREKDATSSNVMKLILN
jgi:N-acetylneuraminic acid mutarotase